MAKPITERFAVGRFQASFAAGIALFCCIAVYAQAIPTQKPGAPVVTGTVTVDGAPRAGVTVQAVPAGGTAAVATTTTGADGAYRLTGLTRGVYRFEFAAGPKVQPASRMGIVVYEDVPTELSVAMHSAENQEPSPSEACNNLKTGEVCVRIETPLGFIFIAVDTAHASATSANFLKYVDGGFYSGGRFHRATRPDNYKAAPPNRPMMEIIQGGINPDLRSKGFPPIPLERTSVTGLKHVRGTVSMARGAPDTATSDFFILIDDQPSLDFGGMRFDDGQGGAAFGRVTVGMSVVRRIQQQPVTEQALTPPVTILRMFRVN